MGTFLEERYVGPVIIVGAFVLLFAAEHLRPLRRRSRPLRRRLIVNLFMSALTFAPGGLIVTPVAMLLAGYAAEHRLGVLHITGMPLVAKFVLGFLLLDLTFYYWHRLNHRVPLMWRFHNAHHIDPDLDTTTSFRFHFVEILYSTGFRAVQVLLLGVAPATIVIYEIVFNCCTLFHHSNFRLPVGMERLLNGVFVTPRMHGIHHSIVGREANSNYSVVFSVWDRLNRSLRLNIPQAGIAVGVAAYMKPRDNGLAALLLVPFRRQRRYWRLEDGSRPGRRTTPPAGTKTHLAE